MDIEKHKMTTEFKRCQYNIHKMESMICIAINDLAAISKRLERYFKSNKITRTGNTKGRHYYHAKSLDRPVPEEIEQ